MFEFGLYVNPASEDSHMNSRICTFFLALSILLLSGGSAWAEEADLILHHGKVATVDPSFSIQQAIAVKGGHILQVGRDAQILKLRGKKTEVVDLHGKMVPDPIESRQRKRGCMAASSWL